MQRYFGSLTNNTPLLSEDDVHHITHVMRMKKDDEFEFVSEGELYLCAIDSLKPFSTRIVEKLHEDVELKERVTLLFALAKGDKIDFVIQKATELGAHRIVLFKSQRCVVNFSNEDFQKKVVRFNRIAKEASEQSHRLTIPEILGVVDISSIPDEYKSEVNLIAYEKEAGRIDETMESVKNKSVSIVIGPEGGFTPQEVQLLNKKGFASISLGKRILRCETAAVYALSVIGYLKER